jgi:hypothetical protein
MRLKSLALAALVTLMTATAHAGIFDLPGYLEAGQWSIGAEPEIAISDGTGAAINLKPRYGVNDFLNWEGLIGTGSGARKFRIGITADLDWFPDYENQPGIATPLFVEYYRIDEDGQLNFGAKPMIYKTFHGQDAAYTPFVGVPIGWALRNSKITGIVQVAMGSMFKPAGTEHVRFTIEAGFNAANSYSYLSGGVTYYF